MEKKDNSLERKELAHEPVPIFIPVFWVVAASAAAYLALVFLKVIQ